MTETGNCINRVLREGGYGGYLVARGPKGALSEEVTFKLKPEGGEGIHCVRIWGRVLWTEGTACAKILG